MNSTPGAVSHGILGLEDFNAEPFIEADSNGMHLRIEIVYRFVSGDMKPRRVPHWTLPCG